MHASYAESGTNIAATVDVRGLAAYGASLPNVVVSRDYKYLCSDPGQDLIRQDAADYRLNRIVVAACSPHLHENTFRAAAATAGLNRYFLHMVNIREHDSLVHEGKQEATRKAQDLLRAGVRRVARHDPLKTERMPIHPDVLVVGGGIAGIHAALTLANAGKHVYLVEREPSIGGHMAKFDRTFPTLDCAACILTPKMSAVKGHPNITLWTYSDVIQVSGYVGHYQVKVKRWPRYSRDARLRPDTVQGANSHSRLAPSARNGPGPIWFHNPPRGREALAPAAGRRSPCPQCISLLNPNHVQRMNVRSACPQRIISLRIPGCEATDGSGSCWNSRCHQNGIARSHRDKAESGARCY